MQESNDNYLQNILGGQEYGALYTPASQCTTRENSLQGVHYMFTLCSLYVHYIFTVCSLIFRIHAGEQR